MVRREDAVEGVRGTPQRGTPSEPRGSVPAPGDDAEHRVSSLEHLPLVVDEFHGSQSRTFLDDEAGVEATRESRSSAAAFAAFVDVEFGHGSTLASR